MEEIYEAKLAAARAAINDETVWTAFEKNLKDDGGITDAALRECSYEDLNTAYKKTSWPKLSPRFSAATNKSPWKQPPRQ